MRAIDARRTPMEMLAEDFTRRLRAGDNPDLDEYVERYPAYADEIRNLFPLIAILEPLRDEVGVAKILLLVGRYISPAKEPRIDLSDHGGSLRKLESIEGPEVTPGLVRLQPMQPRDACMG